MSLLGTMYSSPWTLRTVVDRQLMETTVPRCSSGSTWMTSPISNGRAYCTSTPAPTCRNTSATAAPTPPMTTAPEMRTLLPVTPPAFMPARAATRNVTPSRP